MKVQYTRLLGFLCLAAVSVAALAQGITVNVDGHRVDFGDQQPIQRDGRVLVPLRGVFEQMGANVKWEPETQTVIADSGSTQIKLIIGSRTAWINNSPQTLDVPAQLVNGRTLVPLRFLSEALGADVRWFDSTREVIITTAKASTGTVVTPPKEVEVRVLEDTVLPVSLNEELDSATAKAGKKFSANILMSGEKDYEGIPKGSRVIGEVISARPKSGNDPGVLELAFQHVRLPDGRTYPIDGSLIDLTGNDVTADSGGTITAKASRKKDQRVVFAGYGAGAGLIVGLLTDRPLEGAIIGGILGYIVGEIDRAKKQDVRNVTLEKGTKFGVVLNQNLVMMIKEDK